MDPENLNIFTAPGSVGPEQEMIKPYKKLPEYDLASGVWVKDAHGSAMFVHKQQFIKGDYLINRGEQPESSIDSNPGALRGDTPLSETERSEV